MNRDRLNERGVILIALLWILMALTVIALSFSRESFVEVAVARNSRDLADAYYVARAGMSAVIYQLIEKRFKPRVVGLEIAEPDPLELGSYSGNFAGGTFHIDIQDESGKISLNTVAEDQLRALLDALEIERGDRDVIVDSMMDWRDVDSLHRPNGAEDQFYQALPRPYKPKNGRMETVEEMLLVRGVSREYFYGERVKGPDGNPIHRFGLSRYFSVYSNRPQININFAEPAVLLSIPGMIPHTAELIYQRRKSKPFKNVAEITQELPITLPVNVLQYLSTDTSGTYTLTASARMENSKAQRIIRAVVTLDAREERAGYKIVYWNESVPDL